MRVVWSGLQCDGWRERKRKEPNSNKDVAVGESVWDWEGDRESNRQR